MIMLHGNPIIRLVNRILSCVLEADLLIKWKEMHHHVGKVQSGKIGVDEYYSFRHYHMQPAVDGLRTKYGGFLVEWVSKLRPVFLETR